MSRKRRDLHVYKEAGGTRWFLAGAGRRRSSHRRQATAVRAARAIAKRRNVDVNTHARNGRIRAKNSYGNESETRDK